MATPRGRGERASPSLVTLPARALYHLELARPHCGEPRQDVVD